MVTIVFPGYSSKNRVWADEVVAKVGNPDLTRPVYWEHWEDETQKFDPKDKAEKAASLLTGEDEINIISKSIGTLVAMLLAPEIKERINKIILCGIPLSFLKENKFPTLPYQNLKEINPEKVIIFQNENDPLGSHKQVSDLIGEINPEVKIISKDRNDHDYPFYEDFDNFLES